jgi:hypothetical protein
MAAAIQTPDAREVDRIRALVTVVDASRVDAFLDRAVVGSQWRAHVRTAAVSARVLERAPLGTFDEHICTCLTLGLDLPVPVEPGLRFQLVAHDDPELAATALVRPWGG